MNPGAHCRVTGEQPDWLRQMRWRRLFTRKVMAKVIIVGGMCGIVTSWNSFLLGGSRAMYSMAESYMIPKFFAKLHPKHKTPVNALILIGASDHARSVRRTKDARMDQ